MLLYTKKTDDIYKDIAEDVEARFDTSSYELECNLNDGSFPLKEKIEKELD